MEYGFSLQQVLKPAGCCQTNANSSLPGQDGCPLRGAKTAPLGESGGAFQFEDGARRKTAFLIEEVVDRGVDGDEQL